MTRSSDRNALNFCEFSLLILHSKQLLFDGVKLGEGQCFGLEQPPLNINVLELSNQQILSTAGTLELPQAVQFTDTVKS